MFKKLRNKLKSWTDSLSKTEESEEEKETLEEPKEKSEKEETKKPEKKEKKKSKKEPQKEEFYEKPEIPKQDFEEKETIEEIIETPKKFNVGTQKYEPDLEKLEEIEKDLEEEKDTKKQDKEVDKNQNKKEVITSEKISTSDSEEQIGKAERKAVGDAEDKEKKPEKQKKGFFQRFSQKKHRFTEEDFEEYSEELEMLLIENNVAIEVAEKIVQKIKENLLEKEFSKKELESKVKESFKEVLDEILVKPFNLIEEIKKSRKEKPNTPYVILFCGINGTGKTTSIAKFAKLLQKNKLTSVMAAGDTFRAASIEQLKKHGSNLDINVIAHEYGSDPASVGFDAIKYAEKNNLDVVLIDTAGRMHTEKNLMSQIEKISKVTNPNTKIFVGESTTGNDILEQVNAFNSSIQIDGIILSKADIDEKGGTALSVGYTSEKPILYLGVGQNYEDLEPFDKEKFIEKLGL